MTDELKKYMRLKKKSVYRVLKMHILEQIHSSISTYSNLGDYYYQMENYEKAYSYYKLALTMEVAGKNIRKDLEEIIRRIIKKIKKCRKRKLKISVLPEIKLYQEKALAGLLQYIHEKFTFLHRSFQGKRH